MRKNTTVKDNKTTRIMHAKIPANNSVSKPKNMPFWLPDGVGVVKSGVGVGVDMGAVMSGDA